MRTVRIEYSARTFYVTLEADKKFKQSIACDTLALAAEIMERWLVEGIAR